MDRIQTVASTSVKMIMIKIENKAQRIEYNIIYLAQRNPKEKKAQTLTRKTMTMKISEHQ